MYSTLEHIVIKFETNVNLKRRVQLIINFIILQIPTKMALHFSSSFFKAATIFCKWFQAPYEGWESK